MRSVIRTLLAAAAGAALVASGTTAVLWSAPALAGGAPAAGADVAAPERIEAPAQSPSTRAPTGQVPPAGIPMLPPATPDRAVPDTTEFMPVVAPDPAPRREPAPSRAPAPAEPAPPPSAPASADEPGDETDGRDGEDEPRSPLDELGGLGGLGAPVSAGVACSGLLVRAVCG